MYHVRHWPYLHDLRRCYKKAGERAWVTATMGTIVAGVSMSKGRAGDAMQPAQLQPVLADSLHKLLHSSQPPHVLALLLVIRVAAHKGGKVLVNAPERAPEREAVDASGRRLWASGLWGHLHQQCNV